MTMKTKRGLNRRSFVKLLPAGALAAPAVAQQQRQRPPEAPQKVSKEALHTAEQLIGIELTEAQETMALPGVNRNLASYEALRKLDVPLDTEPAISFHAGLPGKKYPRRQPLASGKPSLKVAPLRLSKTAAPQFSSLEDLAFCTVLQLAELVRTRKVSSVDLTKMYLGRLKRYGPKLNCTITLTEELALEQAGAADRQIAAGRYRGSLHGIPWGAKDLFATKGIPTTWGAEPYREQVIDYDATVVERLRAAGAVLIAKLSMGALAQGGLWFGGMTRTPWKPDETSSGSSAGSAATTAAGLVGFALGTETLGSIVSPCSRCGTTGLRPTYGRISRYGAMGLSWTMDKIGPICRAAEDCAAVLSAIYGPDNRDLTVPDIPFHWAPDTPLASLRIGYLKEEFEQGDAERQALYKQALEALRGAGARLEPLELPKFPAQNLRFILSAEAATAFDDLTRSGGVNQLSGQAPGDWPNVFRTSRFITAVEYLRAQRARTLLMRAMDSFMEKWDAFVSPAPGSASLLVTNLTGHPAVVAPCGFIKELPLTIMFTGGLYDEAAPLRVALAFQQATKWHTMHPKLD
jgi:Asp-tRNA(Asn)/Glu-tRNA(Gln) amidotransferase A subunit family amidase